MVTSSSTSVTSQKYKTTRSVGAGTKDFKSLRLLLIHGRSDEFKTAMCERESTQTVMISSKVFHQRCLANRGNFSYAPMRSCIINKAQSCRTSLNCVMHSVMYLQHCLLYLCECSSHRCQETASSQEFTLHGRVAKGHSVDFCLCCCGPILTVNNIKFSHVALLPLPGRSSRLHLVPVLILVYRAG